jgi:hypothetical protein
MEKLFWSCVVHFVSPHFICQGSSVLLDWFFLWSYVFLRSISAPEHLLPADLLLTDWSHAYETRCVVRSLHSCLDPAAMVIVFLHFVLVRSGLPCYQFCFLLAGTWFCCWYFFSRLLYRFSFSTARSARRAKFRTESLVRARKLAREHSTPADSRWSEMLKNIFPLWFARRSFVRSLSASGLASPVCTLHQDPSNISVFRSSSQHRPCSAAELVVLRFFSRFPVFLVSVLDCYEDLPKSDLSLAIISKGSHFLVLIVLSW